MRQIKLDNKPYDRRHIAIHDDFYESDCGNWFVDSYTLEVYAEEFYREHVSQAQEVVDKFVDRMVKL